MGGARALPGRLARPGRVALLPGARLHVPRSPRAARRRTSPSTTGSTCSPTTARRSSRRSRCSGSSPAPTTIPRRSRCWRWCWACSRPATSSARPRASSSTTAATSPRRRPHGGAPRRRHVPRGDARLARQRHGRGAKHRPPRHRLVRSTPTGRSTRSAPSSASFRVRPGRGGRGFEDAVGARRHLAVPAAARTRVAEAEGREYDSYGAEPA